MHFTKLADARSSKACSAWHTGQGCLNDYFHFAMYGRLQAFECFCFFRKKGGTLIVRKISSRNIALCKILI